MVPFRPAARLTALALALLATTSCRFDSAYRDVGGDAPEPCAEGTTWCRGNVLVRCVAGKDTTADDCGARGQACAPTLATCTPCAPAERTCEGAQVFRCDDDGQNARLVETCDVENGSACRAGSCIDLCAEAARTHSNVGCEYWGVDLDNAVTNQGNAAAQQYAIVVSNIEPDLVANVVVEEDGAGIGEPNQLRAVASARVNPRSLEIFKLGPREVDGSAVGTFNTGTGTALGRNAYRVRSNVPLVAYQFNPLENLNVFSNDASLLLPTAALGGGTGRAYVVAGWPQTIATSDDPNQNFGTDLRAFLTIVGTTPNTRVRIRTTARIIAGGPLTADVSPGGVVDTVLQPFDVLNLETGTFNADFTGTQIDATGPVAVHVGSEASDAPFFASLAERSCCADHLEEQLPPLRSIGKSYALALVPNRSDALAAAGAQISHFDEPSYFRVVATSEGKTTVTTTLPPPYDAFELEGEGASATLVATKDALLTADKSVVVAYVQASQEAAGVARALPGGDPSLTFVPPTEQWRNDYVLLTPDKYAFDFLVVTAPFGASVFIDGASVDGRVCSIVPADGLDATARGGADPSMVTYRCQLSFPVVDPSKSGAAAVSAGRQNDGVHRVQSDQPIGVLVYGFDAFVSYAYAGGTDLRDIRLN